MSVLTLLSDHIEKPAPEHTNASTPDISTRDKQLAVGAGIRAWQRYPARTASQYVQRRARRCLPQRFSLSRAALGAAGCARFRTRSRYPYLRVCIASVIVSLAQHERHRVRSL